MIITGTPSAIDEPQRQSILINMVSKYSLINSKKVSGRVYPQAPISDIVSKILSDPSGLNIPKSQQFIDKTINDDTSFCLQLLSSEHVATVPGSSFGRKDSIRISYALSEKDLRIGCKRIKQFCERLI